MNSIVLDIILPVGEYFLTIFVKIKKRCLLLFFPQTCIITLYNIGSKSFHGERTHLNIAGSTLEQKTCSFYKRKYSENILF